MGKIIPIAMIALMALATYASFVDHSRKEAARDDQMKNIYTVHCPGMEPVQVVFRSKTDGDIMTLDGTKTNISESCTSVVSGRLK